MWQLNRHQLHTWPYLDKRRFYKLSQTASYLCLTTTSGANHQYVLGGDLGVQQRNTTVKDWPYLKGHTDDNLLLF